MKARSLLALFFASICPLSGESWFSSNPIGMPKAAIAREDRAKHEYTLSIEGTATGEVRRLFSRDEEAEVKRWERVLAPGSGLVKEKEFRNGEIFSEKEYLAGGIPKLEILYKEGKEDLRIRFEYREGKPVRLVFERPEGSGSYKDEYLYLPSGEFRGVTRTYEDGTTYRSVFSMRNGSPLEEWHSFGGMDILFRYDGHGNVLGQEERRDGALTESVDYFYEDKPPFRIRERKSRDLLRDRETVVQYGEDGHPKLETTSERGMRLFAVRYSYRDDRLVKKEKRSKDTREYWEYEYDDRGELREESYSVNGVLKRKTAYPAKDAEGGYSSVEEYYKEGEVFLRIHYRDGKEAKSEVLKEGQVVRTKEAEDKR